MTFTREINPTKTKSWFLFGPRQTGKSTLVRSLITDRDLYIDLLPQRSFLNYLKQPGRVREEILAHLKKGGNALCVIDEIQKIPGLLDEAHALIESDKVRFILTGSSARKIKRSAANLLAGRAYTYRLFPLTYSEMGSAFDLNRALTIGMLPALWQSDQEDPTEFLRTYTETYLREEIAMEGLARNIGPFSQFLDIAAASDGETVNYSKMARECGVSVKTVQSYYEILEDTFLAHRLPAWQKSARKRLLAHPRFYFFDTGVTNTLCHTLTKEQNPAVRGRRFEQFFFCQLLASIHYRRLDMQLYYWRTNHGAEVDILLCKGAEIRAALEIKSSRMPAKETLTGLYSFLDEHPSIPAFVITIDQRERLLNRNVTVINWDDFILNRLADLE